MSKITYKDASVKVNELYNSFATFLREEQAMCKAILEGKEDGNVDVAKRLLIALNERKSEVVELAKQMYIDIEMLKQIYEVKIEELEEKVKVNNINILREKAELSDRRRLSINDDAKMLAKERSVKLVSIEDVKEALIEEAKPILEPITTAPLTTEIDLLAIQKKLAEEKEAEETEATKEKEDKKEKKNKKDKNKRRNEDSEDTELDFLNATAIISNIDIAEYIEKDAEQPKEEKIVAYRSDNGKIKALNSANNYVDSWSSAYLKDLSVKKAIDGLKSGEFPEERKPSRKVDEFVDTETFTLDDEVLRVLEANPDDFKLGSRSDKNDRKNKALAELEGLASLEDL